MKRVLIVQAGSTEFAVRQRLGDYPEWFARHLAPRAEIAVARADGGELPDATAFDGVLCTGSPRSLAEQEPWMERLGEYLVRAAQRRPVLGVCFGHQAAAVALGGRVRRNPLGREAGTAEIRLTAEGRADPLFAGLPDPLLVQETHEDDVADLPPGAVLLAWNAHSPVQAFAHGRRLRCVQFHPEMDATHSRALAEARRESLDTAAPGGAASVLASIRETAEAERCLHNWMSGFVDVPG